MHRISLYINSTSLYFTVDLTHLDGIGTFKTVTVRVSEEYDKCLARLESDFVSEENAQIWCLRVSLWQHNHNLLEQNINEELQIPQLEEGDEEGPVLRGKRGTRSIRRRIAPRRNMTHPPTGFRIRREYRALSESERTAFHDALNVLYEVYVFLHNICSRSRSNINIIFCPLTLIGENVTFRSQTRSKMH